MRPTKYHDDMPKIAEDFLAKGYTKRSLSAHLEIHEDTLYTWIKEKPDFSEAVELGMAKGLMMFEEMLINKSKNRNNSTHENVLMFILKNRYNDLYNDKQTLEHTGDAPAINLTYVKDDK